MEECGGAAVEGEPVTEMDRPNIVTGGHSSPGLAGRFASGVGARALLMTHMSARFADLSTRRDGAQVRESAAE